ncbi:MAG: hypothetical protein DMD83_27140, partial [Candidatus Rokuibacteriota bacterium]
WVADLLQRVEASGYHAVVLTVDVQVYGRRERDIVHRYSPRQAMSHAPNPRGPDQSYPERLTWDDVAWLKKTTRLPVGLKGIMTALDGRRAVEAGVELVWVSNHGGRQLDHTQASLDALPAVVDAVAGAAAVMVDGGFNRGTAVLKGLALGADVVAVGRTVLWGLAADGAAGVACALGILRRELRTTMALCGQTNIKGLSPDLAPEAPSPGHADSQPDWPARKGPRGGGRRPRQRAEATVPEATQRRPLISTSTKMNSKALALRTSCSTPAGRA